SARGRAGAASARIARERVQGKAAAVEENATVLRCVGRDARLRPGGCRSRDSEYGGESGEDEKGAHRCAPSSGGATAGTNSGRLSLGHVSNVLSRQASIGIGQVP